MRICMKYTKQDYFYLILKNKKDEKCKTLCHENDLHVFTSFSLLSG